MAFIQYDSEESDAASFYNLNFAVGHGQPNTVEDVKVVQFFLKRFFSVPDFKEWKPWGEMKIDGKVGPTTRNWIIKTQIAMDGACVVDGIVDKAGNEFNANNREGSISKKTYMIRMINNVLRCDDTEVYKSLTDHPVVPVRCASDLHTDTRRRAADVLRTFIVIKECVNRSGARHSRLAFSHST